MEDLFKAFYGYWTESNLAEWHFWTYPIASILLVWLLTIVLSKTLFKPNQQNNDQANPEIFKKVFYIFRAAIWATFITMGLLIFGVCYWWAKGLYGNLNLEFSHLLSFILLWVIIIVLNYRLAIYYKKATIREIVSPPISNNMQGTHSLKARKGFVKNRWAIIPGALGFLGLLLLYLRPVSLISIVIDDSGSMGPSLEIGKRALAETFRNFDPNYTKIVITNFGENISKETDPYKNFDALSKVKETNKVNAHTQICNDISEANNFINILGATKQLGLNHAIWQNFLTTQRVSKESPVYGEKVLLIITDGLEYDRSYYNKTLCDANVELDPFYEGNIHWIDLYDRGVKVEPAFNGFYTMMQECYPANVYPGLTMEDYTVAVQSALNKFELDYRLIFWLVILFIIGTIWLFLIRPKSINTR